MKRKSKDTSVDDDLEIPPTPHGFFKGGVMGKYYRGSKLRIVGLDPDVAKVFTNADQVNDALREVIKLNGLSKMKRRKSA